MGKDRGSRYANQKGRKPSTRFARLDHSLLKSNAFRALSPNARSLLIELTMMENGKNNGTGLFLSVRDAADRMGVSDPNTAGRAFEELEEMGFIAVTIPAHFAVKAGDGSRARYWRLTWQAVAAKQGPTCDYEKREPAPKTQARKRMDRGLRALKRWQKVLDEGQPKEKSAVGDFHTLSHECVGKSNTTKSPPWEVEPTDVRNFPTQKRENGGKPPKSL